MAKDKKAKDKPGVQKGGSKSSRWSERTKANKRRRLDTQESRLFKAAERRSRGPQVIDPTTGKIKKSMTIRDRREFQSTRIFKKRKQRLDFAALSPKEKIEHREAGLPSRTVHT